MEDIIKTLTTHIIKCKTYKSGYDAMDYMIKHSSYNPKEKSEIAEGMIKDIKLVLDAFKAEGCSEFKPLTGMLDCCKDFINNVKNVERN